MAADQTQQFRDAAHALNEAGDKQLRKEVYAGLRKIAKPLGEKVLKEGAAELPHRGGLSARIAAGKVAQSNATTGRNPGVALTLRVKAWAPREASHKKGGQFMALAAMDGGILRHPIFANAREARAGWRWTAQPVRPGAFTRPFESGREPVAKEVVAAMEKVAQEITKSSNQHMPRGH